MKNNCKNIFMWTSFNLFFCLTWVNKMDSMKICLNKAFVKVHVFSFFTKILQIFFLLQNFCLHKIRKVMLFRFLTNTEFFI